MTAKNSENTYFYIHDHLGSTSMVLDIDGNISQSVTYVPYGEIFVEERNGAWNSPYLFNSKELDEETGLYYYGARYLNPTNGMWLSVDPLFEKYVGMSPYNYCAGNPVKLVDPDGREISDEESMKDAQHLKMCARLNSMLLERKLNDEGVDKEDLQSRILEFKQTMQDIDDMIADKKHDYKFQKVSENEGNVTIAKDEKNILISYNSVGTRAHEARHGGQIARGKMTVSKNSDGSFGFLNYTVYREVDAYRAQVAFDGNFKYLNINKNPSTQDVINAHKNNENPLVDYITCLRQVTPQFVNSLVDSNFKKIYPPAGMSLEKWNLK